MKVHKSLIKKGDQIKWDHFNHKQTIALIGIPDLLLSLTSKVTTAQEYKSRYINQATATVTQLLVMYQRTDTLKTTMTITTRQTYSPTITTSIKPDKA